MARDRKPFPARSADTASSSHKRRRSPSPDAPPQRPHQHDSVEKDVRSERSGGRRDRDAHRVSAARVHRPEKDCERSRRSRSPAARQRGRALDDNWDAAHTDGHSDTALKRRRASRTAAPTLSSTLSEPEPLVCPSSSPLPRHPPPAAAPPASASPSASASSHEPSEDASTAAQSPLSAFLHRLDALSPGLGSERLGLMHMSFLVPSLLQYQIDFSQATMGRAEPVALNPDSAQHRGLANLLECSGLSEDDNRAFLQALVELRLLDVTQGSLSSWRSARVAAQQRHLAEQHRPNANGGSASVAERTFHPRHTRCPICTEGGDLSVSHVVNAAYYSRERGVEPATVIVLKCAGCRRKYHPTYYVEDWHDEHGQEYLDGDGKKIRCRVYYTDRYDVIQVSSAILVERELAANWASELFVAWCSSFNRARIFNRDSRVIDAALAGFSTKQRLSARLTVHSVQDCYILGQLLQYCRDTGEPLKLHHDGTQADRLREGMRWRQANAAARRRAKLDRHLEHICDRCSRLVYEDGEWRLLRVAVLDLVTIRRNCCLIDYCQVPLRRPRDDAFCPAHADVWRHRCRYRVNKDGVMCGAHVGADLARFSCATPAHRAAEDAWLATAPERVRKEKGRPGSRVAPDLSAAACTIDGASGSAASQDAVLDEDDMDDVHPFTERYHPSVVGPFACLREKRSGKIRQRWRRNATCGRQAFNTACGLRIDECDFYKAETVSGVAYMIRRTWPDARDCPGAISFDNACLLLRHLLNLMSGKVPGVGEEERAYWRTFLGRCKLVCDRFHFTKHKVTDKLCQRFCNPDSFELFQDVDGKRYFNTSIAEQNNLWVGRFFAILRQMGAAHFDFCCSTLSALRNDDLVEALERKGACPRIMTHEERRGYPMQR